MRTVFIGNRIFVLEEILKRSMELVGVFVIEGSHLERQLIDKGLVSFTTVKSKKHLLSLICKIEFDILISNGCPFILPISGYLNKECLLVNIHPSKLPNLRGRDPVPGSLLHGVASGATCHVIDKGIDTGDIISAVEIDYSDNMSAGLLYQLSFIAEKKAFNAAFDRDFKPIKKQIKKDSLIYYSRAPQDQILDFNKDSCDLIVRKIRAYSNYSQGVSFKIKEKSFIAYRAQIIKNDFLSDFAAEMPNYSIVLKYEDSLLLSVGGCLIEISSIKGPLEEVCVGDSL